jgi:hypothetical protein
LGNIFHFMQLHNNIIPGERLVEETETHVIVRLLLSFIVSAKLQHEPSETQTFSSAFSSFFSSAAGAAAPPEEAAGAEEPAPPPEGTW